MSAQTMAEKACEAWFVLEAAALRGLPEPFTVRATEYSGVTEVGLRTVDEFNTWAESLDVEPLVEPVGDDQRHHTAEGALHDFSVRLWTVERVEVPA